MYGYSADHNRGTTIVTSDGKVYERPYGRNRFFLAEENVDADEWAEKATQDWGADWTYLEQEDIDEILGLDESAANLSRETLAANFLQETSDDELKALYDNYGTLRELLRTYVQAFQEDLSHDVYARDFFGESVIKASGLEDTLPYPDEWDDDDDDE